VLRLLFSLIAFRAKVQFDRETVKGAYDSHPLGLAV